LWWDSSDTGGRLWVWYVDADSSQWVEASPNQVGSSFWSRDEATTTVSPSTAGDDVFTSGDVKVGNTAAAPNIDLDASGAGTFAASVGVNTSIIAGLPANTKLAVGEAAGTDRPIGYFYSSDTAYQGSGIRVQHRNTINSNAKFLEGILGTTTTITLNADGSATFVGNITAANVSDARFKTNIEPAAPQLADVVALGNQLKNWDWTDEAPLNDELKARRFLGLVAQEAEKVCPELTYTVHRTKQGKELTPETTDDDGNVTPATYEEVDDSYKAINHDILVMKLLGAVAELQAEVTALKGGTTK
jgi:hypothetical protein